MAWSHVTEYAGQLKTTSDLSVAVTASVGDNLLAIVVSNDVSGSDAISSTAVSDVQGNTWNRIVSYQSQTNAGEIATALFYCDVTTALSSENVTFANSTGAKSMLIYRFTGGSSNQRGSFVSQAQDGVATWSLTHNDPVSGDLVLGFIAAEDADGNSFTGDSDTTNGSWSSAAGTGTTGGGAATNVKVRAQYKIVDATGAQTWNGDINSSYHREILIVLQVAGSFTQANAGSAAVTAVSNSTQDGISPSSQSSSVSIVATDATGKVEQFISAEAAAGAVASNSVTSLVSSEIQSSSVAILSDSATLLVSPLSQSALTTVIALDATVQTSGGSGNANAEVSLLSVITENSQPEVAVSAQCP